MMHPVSLSGTVQYLRAASKICAVRDGKQLQAASGARPCTKYFRSGGQKIEMPFGIAWHENFYGISWAYEKDRLVVSIVFEDRDEAAKMVKEVEAWNDRFTRLTIIEKKSGEYSLCAYQDPQVSKSDTNAGLYRTGMIRAGGYEQVKPLILEKAPLLQIAYAQDVRDMKTYEQVSNLVVMRKCRIIAQGDLKKQEFYYEKVAEETSAAMQGSGSDGSSGN